MPLDAQKQDSDDVLQDGCFDAYRLHLEGARSRTTAPLESFEVLASEDASWTPSCGGILDWEKILWQTQNTLEDVAEEEDFGVSFFGLLPP